MVGSENSVDMCRYAIVVTRVAEGLDNELTGGWKVIEVGAFRSKDGVALTRAVGETEDVGSDMHAPFGGLELTRRLSH